ncbi:MAG: AbrB/MazE/SpoVT family DNA-binding domain-containing protein [Leucobacter sp.]
MSTTYPVSLGDRGRLVVPAALRERLRWAQGTPLLFIETAQGVVLASREQAKQVLRSQLGGASLVDELMSERRSAAEVEDDA